VLQDTVLRPNRDQHRWEQWLEDPDALLALSVTWLWAKEQNLLPFDDALLDAGVALAAGHPGLRSAGLRSVWGPIRSIAGHLLLEARVDRTIAVLPTKAAAELVCGAFRPSATIERLERTPTGLKPL
jgi:hypothetical protein